MEVLLMQQSRRKIYLPKNSAMKILILQKEKQHSYSNRLLFGSSPVRKVAGFNRFVRRK